MQSAVFSDDQFVSAASFTTALALSAANGETHNDAAHLPGLANASALTFSNSGLVLTIGTPAPFAVLFGSGVLAAGLGNTAGSVNQSYAINLAPFIPSGSPQTVYILASAAQVQLNPFVVSGPPPGMPDYDPTFQPYTAYAALGDTLSIAASTTPADNKTTFEIGRFTLSNGQTALGTITTTYQSGIGSVLSQAQLNAIYAAVQAENNTFTGMDTFIGGVAIAAAGAAINAQGLWLSWNRQGGSGASYLLNEKGLGAGGFVFGEATPSNTYTQTLAIDASGNLTAAGSITSGGNVVTGNGDAFIARDSAGLAGYLSPDTTGGLVVGTLKNGGTVKLTVGGLLAATGAITTSSTITATGGGVTIAAAPAGIPSGTGGLFFGNAVANYGGQLLQLQITGTTVFNVDASGNVRVAGSMTVAGNAACYYLTANSNITCNGGAILLGPPAVGGSVPNPGINFRALQSSTGANAHDGSIFVVGGTAGANDTGSMVLSAGEITATGSFSANVGGPFTGAGPSSAGTPIGGGTVGVYIHGGVYQGYAGSNPCMELRTDGGGNGANLMLFYDGGSTSVGAINVSTSGASFVGTSDYRLKEDVETLNGALAMSIVASLRPVSYAWRADPEKNRCNGFIAHELQAVLPEAVFGEKDAVRENDDGSTSVVPQMIDQTRLVPLLIAALQDAHARIAAIEARL